MKLRLDSRSDAYKWGHFLQNRPGTQYISSYIESRGVEAVRDWKEVVVAGAGYYQQEYLSKPLVTAKSIQRLEKRIEKLGVSYNTPGWKHILNKHGGYAPIRLQAVPEGTVLPLLTPMAQLVNLDPETPWIGGWMEPTLLRNFWYASTVATLSFHIKRIIKQYMLETADHLDGLDFKLHDFGARGVSSSESAQIGGVAHLMSFKGSDTFEAIEMASEYYDEDMAGFSVDAAEHSTVTSFGGPAYEAEAYEHLIKEFGQDNKLFSIVSDSYDLFGAIDNIYGEKLKTQIQNLGNKKAKLVVRPDSGNPVEIVVQTINKLMAKFGFSVNSKGYRVLPPYLGVLQGDGINEQSIREILEAMKKSGLSAENIVFGMGGQLLQGVNRDTLKFAMKASAAFNPNFNDGRWYDIVKNPVTDPGKKSKGGVHAVIKVNGVYRTVPHYGNTEPNILEVIHENGVNKKLYTLEEIRRRIDSAL